MYFSFLKTYDVWVAQVHAKWLVVFRQGVDQVNAFRTQRSSFAVHSHSVWWLLPLVERWRANFFNDRVAAPHMEVAHFLTEIDGKAWSVVASADGVHVFPVRFGGWSDDVRALVARLLECFAFNLDLTVVVVAPSIYHSVFCQSHVVIHTTLKLHNPWLFHLRYLFSFFGFASLLKIFQISNAKTNFEWYDLIKELS